MMFRGRCSRSLDDKGRLLLPPEYRELLQARSEGGVFALTTFDNCLVAYLWRDWLDMEAKFDKLPNAGAAVRNFRRLLMGGVEKMTPDSQGRIRLSETHLQYSGITREATLVGQGSRFEIWSCERLAPILEQSFDDVAGDLAQSGINFFF